MSIGVGVYMRVLSAEQVILVAKCMQIITPKSLY